MPSTSHGFNNQIYLTAKSGLHAGLAIHRKFARSEDMALVFCINGDRVRFDASFLLVPSCSSAGSFRLNIYLGPMTLFDSVRTVKNPGKTRLIAKNQEICSSWQIAKYAEDVLHEELCGYFSSPQYFWFF